MTKLEQMDEFVEKIKKDAELGKELAAVLQSENPEDTVAADKWLADNGYGFTVKELGEHMQDGIPLAEEQLDAVAGGAMNAAEVSNKMIATGKNRVFNEFQCWAYMKKGK